ncbi:MAG: 50S ribosomal protein L1 [Patescibacteria group bacterium]|nr:50S ribosomal protein L1 [Patescibacteria group bacterium]MCL5095281.1 50S ribosomal protein L1 [Patescibacteria group bacterium]
MGKIRIKTLGSDAEKAQKEHDKTRREEKKKRLVHLANLKGGQKLVDMTDLSTPTPETEIEEEAPTTPEETKKKAKIKEKKRSTRYLEAKKLIDPGKLYSLSEALSLIKKTNLSRFDGAVEVHLNTTEKGIRGQVSLPHGTGKQIRVAIADDELLAEIEKGKINFDILVSSPTMMAKLAKVAKILGPKGLMPNPKSGTISQDPEKLAKSLSSGQIQFKTETEAPIIHLVIGKTSFSDKDLEDNFKALIATIGSLKIKTAYLKTTMSPAVKVNFA